jgi:hypothetical protein
MLLPNIIAVGLALASYYEELKLEPNESRDFPLNDIDVFFLNSFSKTSSDVRFVQDPAMTGPLDLSPGSGVSFRGDKLTITSLSRTSQVIPLWLLPKGVCCLNNFIMYANFSLAFQARQFTPFCLFTPLTISGSRFRVITDRKSSELRFIDAEMKQPTAVLDSHVYAATRPFILFANASRTFNTFRFEIEALGPQCALRPVTDVGSPAISHQWALVETSCDDFSRPAFSLPLTCFIGVAMGGIIGFFLHVKNWIDLKGLFGLRTTEEVRGTAAGHQAEEHLDIREIEPPDGQRRPSPTDPADRP